MLTREQAQKLAEKALSFSKAPDCSVSIVESEQSFLRFANNGVTTSGLTLERTVNISSTRNNKTGASQTTNFDDDSIRAAVLQSEQLAEIAPENPERVEPLGPQKYNSHDNWDERTASARNDVLVPQVKAVIDAATGNKLVAAGFFNRVAAVSALANKRGLFGFQRATDSRLSTTIRATDGSSSGWASQPSVRIAEINGADLGSRAAQKCLRWKKPVKLEPGRYTVVLEPTASGADLVSLLGQAFSARQAEEGRSFLSKKGGGTLIGEKLFPEIVTLRSDPFDKRFPASLWGPAGLPNAPITWVEKGVVKNLSYDRYWAEKAGSSPTPPFSSIVFEGSNSSLNDLIKATDRGLLVTRFWYIRVVNPQTVQLTGLTRDGLFLIEKGEVSQAVVNLRFNESPVRLLQNIEKVGLAERVRGGEGSGMIAPPVLARDFNFTSISDAV